MKAQEKRFADRQEEGFLRSLIATPTPAMVESIIFHSLLHITPPVMTAQQC